MKDALDTMNVMQEGLEDLYQQIQPNVDQVDRKMCNEFKACCVNMRATCDNIEKLMQHRLDTMGQ